MWPRALEPVSSDEEVELPGLLEKVNNTIARANAHETLPPVGGAALLTKTLSVQPDPAAAVPSIIKEPTPPRENIVAEPSAPQQENEQIAGPSGIGKEEKVEPVPSANEMEPETDLNDDEEPMSRAQVIGLFSKLLEEAFKNNAKARNTRRNVSSTRKTRDQSAATGSRGRSAEKPKEKRATSGEKQKEKREQSADKVKNQPGKSDEKSKDKRSRSTDDSEDKGACSIGKKSESKRKA